MERDEEGFKEEEGAPPTKEESAKKQKELKEKYGVTEEIPERMKDEEVKSTSIISKDSGEVDFSEVLLKVEKLDGKLDVLMGFKENTEERINSMSENIGELRSMFLEKEKFLTKVEKDMEIVTESVSSIDTERIRKQFLKKESEMEELKADIEKLEAMIMAVQEENRKFLGSMDKVKDVENLVNASEKINEKLMKIDETKAYSDRVASKVEVIFSELNEKLAELQRRKEQIDKVDELTTDIVKMLDSMTVKFTNFVEKGDFDKFKSDTEKKMSAMAGISVKNVNFVDKAEFEKFKGDLVKMLEREIKEKSPSAVIATKSEELALQSLKEKWKDKLVKENLQSAFAQ